MREYAVDEVKSLCYNKDTVLLHVRIEAPSCGSAMENVR